MDEQGTSQSVAEAREAVRRERILVEDYLPVPRSRQRAVAIRHLDALIAAVRAER